ncbi:tetratricopeptide repeat-containing protein [Besnoitia besnoiti]|uniref:Tetratricopeptide repeat-containing protein n=1 Tax=Besnoitia besnoiti TaxID=94643 RepID=A0A2A9MG12_BESBE|nr:tetratricopeptide repeat-containing protein [Besnoitia besnoiti]PFH34906.1 tetratricopeptide repeat-containing protein [Besnoitia besnoiti]
MATAVPRPRRYEKPSRRDETLSHIPVDRESEREALVSMLEAAFCKGPQEIRDGLRNVVARTRGGELLKEGGSNPASDVSLLCNFKDDIGRTALHYACLGRRPVNAEWILKACPVIVNYEDSTGETALMKSCRAGDVVIVNILLHFDADVDARSQTGITALHLAAESGDEACVKALLDAGAEVNCFSEISGSPLQYAVMNNHYGATEELLMRGANPNYPFNDASTKPPTFPPALVFACNMRQDAIAELLLVHKADPNIRDQNNWTALQCAAESGSYRATEALLEAGADPDVVTQGVTAFDLAMQNENWAIADLLKDKTCLLLGAGSAFEALQEARQKRREMQDTARKMTAREGQQQVDDAMKAKADGDAFSGAGDFALAAAKYTQALELMPDNPTLKQARATLYASRSMMYLSMGDLESAERDAELATELDPLWSKGYAAKARVYKEREQFDEYTKQLYEACKRQTTKDEELIAELKEAIAISRRNQDPGRPEGPPTVVEING